MLHCISDFHSETRTAISKPRMPSLCRRMPSTCYRLPYRNPRMPFMCCRLPSRRVQILPRLHRTLLQSLQMPLKWIFKYDPEFYTQLCLLYSPLLIFYDYIILIFLCRLWRAISTWSDNKFHVRMLLSIIEIQFIITIEFSAALTLLAVFFPFLPSSISVQQLLYWQPSTF